MRYIGMAALLICVSTAATASPGVGDPIYGATVEKGATEFEARYGRLTNGAADGQDGLVIEAEHAFASNFSLAGLIESSREPGVSRKVEALAIEGVYTLGKVKALNLDTALYAEFKHGLHGEPDAIEAKALFEHRAGAFDGRLNLIAEQPLRNGEKLEFAYAASVDWAVFGDELRLGLAAFGDMGTPEHFAHRKEHFIGPEAKFEIEHLGPGEIEIETGWLRAFGAARDITDGQARLLIGYEAHF